MWVITRSINEYNQDGDYFEMVFDHKPTIDELNSLGYDGVHLVLGGCRKNCEDTYYYLTKILSGEKYKPYP